MKKKLLLILTIPTMLLASCNSTTSSVVPTTSSKGNPTTTESNSNPTTDSDQPAPTLKNQSRTGAINLDIKGLELVAPSGFNFHTPITVAYTTANNHFNLSGANTNIQVAFDPTIGVAYDSADEDGNPIQVSAQDAALSNFEALSVVYGFFDGSILSLAGSMLPAGLSDSFSGTYKAPAAYYFSLGSQAEGGSLLTKENIKDYSETFSLSYLNGEQFYFADTYNKQNSSTNSKYKKVRSFGEKESKMIDLPTTIKTVAEMISGIDLESFDVLGLLSNFLPADFVSSDNAIARALEVLAAGLEMHKTTRDVDGLTYTDIALSLNDSALDVVNNKMMPALAKETGQDMLSGINLSYIDLTLSTYPNVNGYTSISDLKFNVGLATDIAISGFEGGLKMTPSLALDINLGTEETALSDTYFTDLQAQMEFYAGLNDQFLTFFELAKPYIKFINIDKPERNIDLSDLSAGDSIWSDLGSKYKALNEDVKFMVGNSIDGTTFTDDAKNPFKVAATMFDKVKLPEGGTIDEDTISTIFNDSMKLGPITLPGTWDVTVYKNWKKALRANAKTKPAMDKVDAFYQTKKADWDAWKKVVDASIANTSADKVNQENLQKLQLALTQNLPGDATIVPSASKYLAFLDEDQQTALISSMQYNSDSNLVAETFMTAFNNFAVKNLIDKADAYTALIPLAQEFNYDYANGVYTINANGKESSTSFLKTLLDKLANMNDADKKESLINSFSGSKDNLNTALGNWSNDLQAKLQGIIGEGLTKEKKKTLESTIEDYRAQTEVIKGLTEAFINVNTQASEDEPADYTSILDSYFTVIDSIK